MTRPDEIMAAYRAAYLRANGRSPQIDYFRGWYSIYTGGASQMKCRGSEVQRFIATLNARDPA